MQRLGNVLGIGALIFIVMFGGGPFRTGRVAAQTDKVQEACNPGPDQNETVQLTYQDYTNLIAGTSPADASILEKCVNPAGWQAYAAEIAESWQQFEQKNLQPMRAWATQEIGPTQTVEGTVFYPFSGPDAVNMLAFFPQAKNYLLIALEPVGTLPVLKPGQNEPFFTNLQLATSELLQFNFFFTKVMAQDLVKREMDGVLPVLLYFLGRENLRVLDIKYWLMQPDGSITEKPVKGGDKLTGDGVPGVKIVFQRGEGAPEQTLYYFSFNLQNGSWQSHPQFVKFLKGFAPYRTFLKAASYLMFKPKFNDIRQFILERSQLVLQTDEGIPLKYFDPESWDRRFYGNYSCPIQLFANCFQSDMAGIYRQSQSAAPLPFGIGYHHRQKSSNLMLGSRKAVVAQEVAK
jgi:hypothetical protein